MEKVKDYQSYMNSFYQEQKEKMDMYKQEIDQTQQKHKDNNGLQRKGGLADYEKIFK